MEVENTATLVWNFNFLLKSNQCYTANELWISFNQVNLAFSVEVTSLNDEIYTFHYKTFDTLTNDSSVIFVNKIQANTSERFGWKMDAIKYLSLKR